MSLLLRVTARRSFNTALVNTHPVVARAPLLARPFSNHAVQANEQKEELMRHAPGWKRENASESEASVKADREPYTQDVSHMQNETVKHLKNGEENAVDNLKTRAAEITKEYVDKAKSMGSQVSDQGDQVIDKARQAGEEAKKTREVHPSESERKSPDYVDKAKKEMHNAQGLVMDSAQEVMQNAQGMVDIPGY
ncbi:hypothetical protein BGX23_001561, partial [Mortierella sp. AD031]